MSINYRVKKKKRKASDSKITLAAQHSKKMNEFYSFQQKIPSMELKLKKLKKEKDTILNSNNGLGFIDSENGKRIYVLNKKIRELEKKINDIKNSNIKHEYFSKTAHLLYNYYENVKEVSNRHKSNTQNLSVDDYAKEYEYGKPYQPNKRNVIDLLNKSKKNKSYSSTKISDFVDMKEKSNRANLLQTYTKIMDPSKYKPDVIQKKIEIDICNLCEVEMSLIQSEGIIVCPQCGREEHILIDSDKPSYKDPPPEAGEFTYKRINRFDEWLTQYQAKETTEIPQEVLDSILLEMKKEGITNLCRLNMEKVRGYLKKLGLNKYYEHIPHIIYCLNGLPTPRLTPEVEEKLRSMFRQIQDIFDKVCPDNRTNFLSYSYLLRKLLELLGEDEHKEYFRLHKSREKIYQHDKVWKKICKILKWQYLRSV